MNTRRTYTFATLRQDADGFWGIIRKDTGRWVTDRKLLGEAQLIAKYCSMMNDHDAVTAGLHAWEKQYTTGNGLFEEE